MSFDVFAAEDLADDFMVYGRKQMKENRSVLITGGTRGIGLATAKKFLENGNRVVVASIDEEEAVQEALQELKALGEVSYFRLDIADEKNCREVVDKTVQLYGSVDVLCNIAGIVGELKPPLEADIKNINKVIQVDLIGTISMSICAGRYMKEQKKGVILNTSSICGFMAANVSVGYHAAKGGVNLVTKVFAKELSPFGIRCVAVAPATVRTRLMNPSIEDEASLLHMKQRVEEPEEIAGVFYLLSLDEASAINGTTVMADDGFCSFKGVW